MCGVHQPICKLLTAALPVFSVAKLHKLLATLYTRPYDRIAAGMLAFTAPATGCGLCNEGQAASHDGLLMISKGNQEPGLFMAMSNAASAYSFPNAPAC